MENNNNDLKIYQINESFEKYKDKWAQSDVFQIRYDFCQVAILFHM